MGLCGISPWRIPKRYLISSMGFNEGLDKTYTTQYSKNSSD
jgi:hypothetical protein